MSCWSTMHRKFVRNFCIIAHIDHGKSTLADRFLEATHTVAEREIREQTLDDMELERERGITIKSHPVRMFYRAKDGRDYQLNLIDTPGHVDFTYEVARSLSACEGALLLVDAVQGVQAQTIANLHLARERNVKLIPVINKIDLPSANVPVVTKQIEEIIGLRADEIVLTSAKDGTGVIDVLDAIVERIPEPQKTDVEELRAFIFDSVYNAYRGVVVYVRVFSGQLAAGMTVRMMESSKAFEIMEVGVFAPHIQPTKQLRAGEVGYFMANIKDAQDVRVGDTVTDQRRPAAEPLPGRRELTPMVFSGLYPVDVSQFDQLKAALDKLKLNDPAFVYEPESSVALGFGFRCGFLGLLHLEVIFERIGREFDIATISTSPSVKYHVRKTDGSELFVDNPLHLPPTTEIERIEEPMVLAYIITPNECIGSIMQLALDRRGECLETESLDSGRVMMTFHLPLNEIIVDFYDKLKSMTRGYGSLDYEFLDYAPSDLSKLDILINGEVVDAFSLIVHASRAERYGRSMVKKLKDVIPKHLFRIPIQASIGSKIIARETVKALKKNVTAKCYGGDITRKRKLWEKQKEGKKRMKEIGQVRIPQKAFIEVLKLT